MQETTNTNGTEIPLGDALQDAFQASGMKRSDNVRLYQDIHAALTQAKKNLLGPVRAAKLLEILAPGQYEVLQPMARRKK